LVRTMLNQLRTETAKPQAKLPASTTDIELHRVDMISAAIGIHLKAGAPPFQAPSPSALAIRVNAGGPEYTDSLGQIWNADTAFSGGNTFTSPKPVSAHSKQSALYQTERFGNFRYQFPLPNGLYKVTLKFAENWFTEPNQRVFSVSCNGRTILSDFDIVAEAGGQFIAVDKSFTTRVNDGQLTLSFSSTVDNAKIDAIEILPVSQ